MTKHIVLLAKIKYPWIISSQKYYIPLKKARDMYFIQFTSN